MDIYHLALTADWAEAKAAGDYRISTRGRTLETEGFIHCCYADQVSGVAERYWRGVGEPVSLLRIDAAAVPDEIIAENTAGGIELFPHLYGPLPLAAVVGVIDLPLDMDGSPVVPPA